MKPEIRALQSILQFCEGYEKGERQKAKDYYILKRFVKEQLEKAEKGGFRYGSDGKNS